MHKRLKYSRVYLVGPMDFNREAGKVWREELEEFLFSHGVIPLNPYKKPLYYGQGQEMLEDDDCAEQRRKWQENEQYDELSGSMKVTRAVDLRMVDHADFIIVYLNFEVIMTGTLEELFWGNREKKPIIILSSVPKKKMPPWYFGTVPHKLFFTTMDEVKEYIRHIDEDDEIDTLHRWIFFDLEPMINEIHDSQGLGLW